MQLFCILRCLACAVALMIPQVALAKGSIVVLGASGSTWGQIGGQTKLEISQTSLTEVRKSIPAGTELGLIAYGHRDSLRTGYAAALKLTAPLGGYFIKVLRGDVETNATITVKPGERDELTAPGNATRSHATRIDAST